MFHSGKTAAILALAAFSINGQALTAHAPVWHGAKFSFTWDMSTGVVHAGALSCKANCAVPGPFSQNETPVTQTGWPAHYRGSLKLLSTDGGGGDGSNAASRLRITDANTGGIISDRTFLGTLRSVDGKLVFDGQQMGHSVDTGTLYAVSGRTVSAIDLATRATHTAATLPDGATAQSVAVNASGNVFVIAANRVLEFSPDLATQTEFASLPANDTHEGAAFDDQGNLYIAGSSAILKYTPAGGHTILAFVPHARGLTFDSGRSTLWVSHASGVVALTDLESANQAPALGNSLSDVRGAIAADPSGAVYAAQSDAITAAATRTRTVTGLTRPSALAFSAGGTLYVATKDRIEALGADGATAQSLSVAGAAALAYGATAKGLGISSTNSTQDLSEITASSQAMFTTADWPEGITGVFSPENGLSSTLRIDTSNAAPGLYALPILARSGAVTVRDTVLVSVSGSVSPATTGTLPFGVSVTPNAGSGAAGTPQNFQLAWASPTGQLVIGQSAVLFQDAALSVVNVAGSCYLTVTPNGAARLSSDAGDFFSSLNSWVGNSWAFVPFNSQCQLNGPASSLVTLTNAGANQQVTLNLQFNPSLAGKTLAVWLQSQNTNYQNGTWQKFGTFTVTGGGGGSFTLSGTPVTVTAGGFSTSTVTVTPANGFNSPVTLSNSGWPSGITGSFGPNPTTGSSTLTIAVDASVAGGTYALPISGAAGAITASGSVTLTAPAHFLSATNPTIQAGSSGTSTITSTLGSAVTLSTSGWPAGITGTFSPNPATGTSTLTIAVTSTVAANNYLLTVSGTSGSQTASATIVLSVTAAGSVQLPYGVSVTPAAGAGTQGVPQNFQAVWASPVGQPGIDSSYILFQDSALPTPDPTNGCYLTVAAGGAVRLADNAGAFGYVNTFVGNNWTNSPSNLHCALNGPASSLVAVTGGGSNEQVTLNLAFSNLWAGKTLSIWLQSTNVNYQSGTWQRLGTFTLGTPAFTLSSTAANTVAGGSASSTVSVTPGGGGFPVVTLATTGWPAGITGTFGTNPTTNSSNVTIAVASSVAPGLYSLTVTGTAGGPTVTTTIPLTVTGVGALILTATNVAMPLGTTQTVRARVFPSIGGNLTYGTSGWPAGITSTSSVVPGILTLRISIASTVGPGTYFLPVTATNGSLSGAVNITLTVVRVSMTPAALTLAPSTSQVVSFNLAGPMGVSFAGPIDIYSSADSAPCWMIVRTSSSSPNVGSLGLASDNSGYYNQTSDFNVTPTTLSNSRCQVDLRRSTIITQTDGLGNLTSVVVNLSMQFGTPWASSTLNANMGVQESEAGNPTPRVQVGTINLTGMAGMPGLTISAAPVTIEAGGSGKATLTATPTGGLLGQAEFNCYGAPVGISSRSVFVGFLTATCNIDVALDTPAGVYQWTISGNIGNVTATTTIVVTVIYSGPGGQRPYGVSVTPSAGSGNAGTAQNLQVSWAGPTAINTSYILIQDSASSAPTPANSCLIAVTPSGAAALADDSGALGYAYSWVGNGWASSPSNTHCALNGPASSFVATTAGNTTEQVTLNVTFSSAWAGKTLSIWLQSKDSTNRLGSPQQFGTFTVQ